MMRTDSGEGRTYLGGRTAAREQSHRRAVLLGIAALIVLSLSPVLGHHVASRAEDVLAGHDHLWKLCLVSLHLLLAPVHGVFHVLLAAGVAYASWDRLSAAVRVRRTLALLDAEPCTPGGTFAAAAARVGLPTDALRLVDALPNPAFTAGWWRPRVYLARELADFLSPEQLAAVIAHEASHVTRRDPLRLSALRFLGRTLFWIPALRRLADDMADEAEILADDAGAGERPLVLASAIIALAGWSAPSDAGAVRAFPAATAVGLLAGHGAPRDDATTGRDALLDRRVRRLAGEAVPVATHVTRRSLVWATAALAAVWTSGIIMAHPLPAAVPGHPDADHCEHHRRSAFTHLFCLGVTSPPRHVHGGHCPHATRVATR